MAVAETGNICFSPALPCHAMLCCCRGHHIIVCHPQHTDRHRPPPPPPPFIPSPPPPPPHHLPPPQSPISCLASPERNASRSFHPLPRPLPPPPFPPISAFCLISRSFTQQKYVFVCNWSVRIQRQYACYFGCIVSRGINCVFVVICRNGTPKQDGR